jgi:Leucine-rich repeat (LRR) protein
LQRLGVNHTKIRDPESVASLSKLESLDVSGTDVHDLTPLSSLERLRYLSVRECAALTDFAPIGKIATLETLNVAKTGFADVEVLLQLPRLREVCTYLSGIENGTAAHKRLASHLAKRGGALYDYSATPLYEHAPLPNLDADLRSFRDAKKLLDEHEDD